MPHFPQPPSSSHGSYVTPPGPTPAQQAQAQADAQAIADALDALTGTNPPGLLMQLQQNPKLADDPSFQSNFQAVLKQLGGAMAQTQKDGSNGNITSKEMNDIIGNGSSGGLINDLYGIMNTSAGGTTLQDIMNGDNPENYLESLSGKSQNWFTGTMMPDFQAMDSNLSSYKG